MHLIHLLIERRHGQHRNMEPGGQPAAPGDHSRGERQKQKPVRVVGQLHQLGQCGRFWPALQGIGAVGDLLQFFGPDCAGGDALP
jgi:hypothetical protein